MSQETIFSQLISVADDAIICIDERFAIRFFNAGAEKIFGYTSDEVIGQPLTILMPDDLADRHDALVRGFALTGQRARQMADRQSVSGKRKSGASFPAQVSIMRGEPNTEFAYAAILRDASLIASLDERSLLLAAIAASDAAIAISDTTAADQPLVYMTEAFERLTGYTPHEAIGRNCRFLQGPNTDPDSKRAFTSLIASGKSGTILIQNYRKDGTPFWNRVSLSPIHGQGNQIEAYVAVLQDVTEERDREAAKIRAQHLETLGRLSGTIAHEVNNWIQPALSVNQLVVPYLLPETPARVSKFLESVETSSLHIRTIVQDVLEYAKSGDDASINRIETAPGVKPIPLGPAINNAFDLVSHVLPDSIHIHRQIDLPNPFTARVTATGLLQVLTNLCKNACQAMNQSGDIEVEAVTVASQSDSDAENPNMLCRITIRDNGPGLPTDLGQAIFMPFVTTHAREGGSGLGLSVVRREVFAWGGTINAQSNPAGGAEFVITIPVDMSSDMLGETKIGGAP